METKLPHEPSERESWRMIGNKFYEDILILFEKQGELIRTELSEKTAQLKTTTTSLLSAGIILFVGFISVAATLVIFLSFVMNLWMASTIVSAAFLIVGGAMYGVAKKRLKAHSLTPRKSIEAFSEIRHSLKEKVNEITKH